MRQQIFKYSFFVGVYSTQARPGLEVCAFSVVPYYAATCWAAIRSTGRDSACNRDKEEEAEKLQKKSPVIDVLLHGI